MDLLWTPGRPRSGHPIGNRDCQATPPAALHPGPMGRAPRLRCNKIKNRKRREKERGKGKGRSTRGKTGGDGEGGGKGNARGGEGTKRRISASPRAPRRNPFSANDAAARAACAVANCGRGLADATGPEWPQYTHRRRELWAPPEGLAAGASACVPAKTTIGSYPGG